MKYAVILALAFAPCLYAQGRYKPSPDMLAGHFEAPAQETPLQAVELDAPPPMAPMRSGCHGLKCKIHKLTGIAHELTPYAYLGYMVAQNVYSWQRAMDPFPVPKKPK